MKRLRPQDRGFFTAQWACPGQAEHRAEGDALGLLRVPTSGCCSPTLPLVLVPPQAPGVCPHPHPILSAPCPPSPVASQETVSSPHCPPLCLTDPPLCPATLPPPPSASASPSRLSVPKLPSSRVPSLACPVPQGCSSPQFCVLSFPSVFCTPL